MRPLIAVLVLLAAAPAAEARRPPCSKGGSTVAVNEIVRVFERGGALRACLKANRRRSVLARRYDDDYVMSGDYAHPVLAGSFVAFWSTRTDISCKAACPPGYEPTRSLVEIHDVATQDVRSAPVGEIGELALTRIGAAAWIDAGGVHALEDAGVRDLDAGAVSGLEASATRVSWRNGGELRVAGLGAG